MSKESAASVIMEMWLTWLTLSVSGWRFSFNKMLLMIHKLLYKLNHDDDKLLITEYPYMLNPIYYYLLVCGYLSENSRSLNEKKMKQKRQLRLNSCSSKTLFRYIAIRAIFIKLHDIVSIVVQWQWQYIIKLFMLDLQFN